MVLLGDIEYGLPEYGCPVQQYRTYNRHVLMQKLNTVSCRIAGRKVCVCVWLRTYVCINIYPYIYMHIYVKFFDVYVYILACLQRQIDAHAHKRHDQV